MIGDRIRVVGPAEAAPDGCYVLYWMTSERRLHQNPALDRCVELANQFGKPLIIFEPLARDYAFASSRFHQFVREGMREHAAACQAQSVAYLSWLCRDKLETKQLFERLIQDACIVVADDRPDRFSQQRLRAYERCATRRLEAVDGAGLFALQSHPRGFLRAFDFRKFAQAQLMPALEHRPSTNPLAKLRHHGSLEALCPWLQTQTRQWMLEGLDPAMDNAVDARLGIDTSIKAVAAVQGGHKQATARLDNWVALQSDSYHLQRQHPDFDVGSRLSAYLHFGHISAHEIFERVARAGDQSQQAIAEDARWNLPPGLDGFVDQLLVWRELSFNLAHFTPEHEKYESIPSWARASLQAHIGDDRPYLYSRAQLERAETHDSIWNAAQRQLMQTGTIHNYLRMLWGKCVLRWSRTPQEAFETLVYLNDRYALDGRDPNSYAGIGWIFGRFDRPWAPQRPVFGMVRAMTTESAQRKLKLRRYLEEFSGQASLSLPSNSKY